ncbi:hypothetical protein BDQ17DRAFT_1230622 [Cyathus striatus]|nr:hypothetical protein BDQ17DRAFT_1230622 [Cyathus striatus]
MYRHTAICASLLYLLLPLTCFAGTVNVTIDDHYGDVLTQQKPIYLPNTSWSDQTCVGCAIRPDASKAFNGTYIGATYHPELQNVSVTMSFEGIAIYVFFILPNTQANPQVTANTAVNFTIDGQIVGNFTHEPDSSTTDFIFDQMVFNKTDLPQGTHQLIISASGINISTFTNFDYAMYT